MKGQGGMGMSKHRKAGRVPVNSRAKILRAIEANRPVKRRPKPEMVQSVRELFS